MDLKGEIQHYAYRDLAHHFQTMDRYTTLAARQMFEDGRRAGLLDLACIRRPRSCAITCCVAAFATAFPD